MPLKSVFFNLAILFFSISSQGVPPRIGRTVIDKSKVQKLFIAPGRSSILIFPCNIKTFSSGPTNDMTALLNERDSKILEVWISNASNQPAGLKVICNDHFFAFDIIPSRNTHQDFIEVRGAYGIPSPIEESENKPPGRVLLSSRDVHVTDLTKPKSPKVLRIILSSKDQKNVK